MSVLDFLKKLGRKFNGTKTLYDVYDPKNGLIERDILVRDSSGREYLTGEIIKEHGKPIGVKLHPVNTPEQYSSVLLTQLSLERLVVFGE